MNIKENLKLIGKAGLTIVRSIAVIVGIGIAVNWLFALSAFFIIKPLTTWLIGILVVGFMIGMPLAYFFIGKTYGIRRGLYFIFIEKKVALFEYIIYKILNSAKEKVLSQQTLKDRLTNSKTWLAHLPKPIRLLTDFLLSKVPFNEILLEIAKNQDINKENITAISEIIAKKLDEKTPLNLIAPSPKLIWTLVGINLILMFVVLSL